MRNFRCLAILVLFIFAICSANAKIKPQWVKNAPTPGNSSYVFKVVETEGDDLSSARSMTIRVLVSLIEHDENVTIKPKIRSIIFERKQF